MSKTLSQKSSASKVKSKMLEIISQIQKLQNNLSEFGLDIPRISKDLFLGASPKYQADLDYLASIGVQWDKLEAASVTEKLIAHKITDTRLLTDKSNSADIKAVIKRIVANLISLASELADDRSCKSYVSKDIFLSVHSNETQNLAYLESLGISWFQIIILAGIDKCSQNTTNAKRKVMLSFKQMSELFGITTRHFLLFQKLMSHVMNDCPEAMHKFVRNCLGITNADDKTCKSILVGITNFVSYIKTIE